MQPKYSVIIPVYNAEKTLKRCLDTLLAESHSESEIILINDGSEDQSGKICLSYAEKYLNIHYIEKQNGGVSTARNVGLEMATGEYILFVDSDDYVIPGFFSSLDRLLSSFSYDFVLFSYYIL